MLAPKTLLVGADVTRLFGRLRSDGARSLRREPRLNRRTDVMISTGMQMVTDAIRQIDPGVHVIFGGPNLTVFDIAAPALSRLPYRDRSHIDSMLRHLFAAYDRKPLIVRFDWSGSAQSLQLRIYAWTTVSKSWYRRCSLCDFWIILRSAVAEIRRLEAEEQERLARINAGDLR